MLNISLPTLSFASDQSRRPYETQTPLYCGSTERKAQYGRRKESILHRIVISSIILWLFLTGWYFPLTFHTASCDLHKTWSLCGAMGRGGGEGERESYSEGGQERDRDRDRETQRQRPRPRHSFFSVSQSLLRATTATCYLFVSLFSWTYMHIIGLHLVWWEEFIAQYSHHAIPWLKHKRYWYKTDTTTPPLCGATTKRCANFNTCERREEKKKKKKPENKISSFNQFVWVVGENIWNQHQMYSSTNTDETENENLRQNWPSRFFIVS